MFYSDVEAGKKFMGKPRPELDEAWAKFSDGTQISCRYFTLLKCHFRKRQILIVIVGNLIMLNQTALQALGSNATEATQAEGQYLALPEYLHQMHCLDIVRKSYFREDYRDFPLFQLSEDQIWGHIGKFEFKRTSFLSKLFDECIVLICYLITASIFFAGTFYVMSTLV